MIYLNKLSAKINSISSLNLDYIVANKIAIPFLSSTYTKAQLQTWINKRLTVLTAIRDGNYTDAQISGFITTTYNKLSPAGKLIADKILAGQAHFLSPASSSDSDNLAIITLYKFVTTP